MKNKHLINGFIVSLMLTTISAQAQPAWISTIQQYFSKPTQNALITTTAVAGISLLTTFACAWNWWKKSKQVSLLDAIHKKNDIEKGKLKPAKPRILLRSKESLKKQIAHKDKQLKLYARKNKQLESRLLSMAALVVTARQEQDHSCSQNCEHASLELMKEMILDFDQEYSAPLESPAAKADGAQTSSAGCELTATIQAEAV